MRIASLDEIKDREQELWHGDVLAFTEYGPSAETTRKLKVTYRMADCISQGFAPLVYDNNNRPWFFARRAMCVECGHTISVNQPSWMRKHNKTKHGRSTNYSSSSLLYPTEEA